MEKKYDFRKVEKEMEDFWGENEVYKFNESDGRKIFSIDTPPPTVSGKLHIGHIFSYTQAEIIARFKRMQGYNVFYPFGFDDNGLPTERLVEKETGLKGRDLDRKEFIEKCIATTDKYEDEFKEMWQSLGFSVDWSLKYKTIAPSTERISQRAFIELCKMGKAYLKESPVLWCTECQTSIAQAELDIKETETTFNYLKFKTDGGILEVATTRPELLYGCVCLFVNPEDRRYTCFIGRKAVVPLYNYEIPILADDKVDIDKGTGVVMCATLGDTTDAAWYEEHKLPYRKVILPNGRIDDGVPYIGGLKVKNAREEIIKKLFEEDLIIKQESLTHTIGIHERCGKDIEIIPSKQWYIDVLSEKERFLKAADEINWHPFYMKERYINWVKNLKWDWCISRQRYFGIPFPVWYCKDCGKPMLADIEDLPVNPMTDKPKRSCSCGCSEFIPETAVFDTWATSSLTPEINARYKEDGDRSDKILPMSLRTQAHEIIRTWTFYTIVRSLYHTGKLPWKDIMLSGFVLAKKGEKISKSKGNGGPEPREMIRIHSADAIRYWAANSKLGTDTFFGEDDLKLAKRFITKLWNASKFAVMHLEDFNPNRKIDLLPIDRWIMERVKETAYEARRLLEQYEIGSARHVIDELFWSDFCDYYLEIVKDRLYKPEVHGDGKRASGQYALYFSLLNILKLYAIYVPHITEYIYQQFFRKYEGEISIHKLIWLKDSEIDSGIITFGGDIKAAVAEVRKYKAENNLSLKDSIDSVEISCSLKDRNLYELTEKDIKACCSADKVKYIDRF